MRMLVLGGTAWLGSWIAAEALARGHEVTCLARGSSGDVPVGARFVRADRDETDALAAVLGRQELGEQQAGERSAGERGIGDRGAGERGIGERGAGERRSPEHGAGERWDAVLDVARQPGHVRRAVAALEPVADRYLFVSTANVYADQRTLDQREDAPLLEPLVGDSMPSTEAYGHAKVACEQAVTAAFGADRRVVARAGLIGGPGDPSGRTGYWPWRFAHPSEPQGAVLVPDAPDLPTAIIDVRDLASWLVDCAEQRCSGVFNAQGERMRFADSIEVARRVAGHTGRVAVASPAWLLERGVAEWSGPRSLPLWLADPDWAGMNARSTARAQAAGLRIRPLEQTLADALAQEESRSVVGPHGAGLTDTEERTLLAALRER